MKQSRPVSRTLLVPVSLRCEYRVDPLGVDTLHPRLGWLLQPTDSAARGLRQTAYRVLAASSPTLLGMTDNAKREVVANFTAYGGERFHWFGKQGHDWEPDMDNGGAGQAILQLMLMLCDGRRIQLLPAWPADWNATFKLHAPYQTTVEGTVQGGKLTTLTFTPASGRANVSIHPVAAGKSHS